MFDEIKNLQLKCKILLGCVTVVVGYALSVFVYVVFFGG